MEQILIIDRNAVYELDEECFQRKMEAQGRHLSMFRKMIL